MMELWYNHVKSYTQDILEENADNLKRFEVRPGIYSNINPDGLLDVNAADFDISGHSVSK
ncbi:hypothetical protein [Mitsuokella sp. AF33-22]|uniref:hypothetical protein n=1 Tax=Mitsuokella sp. AF33-22 TaxID=2292047 RepID=UPI000E480420|nr:hypothetical protein [Mitsuokella sp. AF33-22]RHM55634.1 hypothetical protein DWZ54_06105 [Mitsuokella sp. AF33-22]